MAEIIFRPVCSACGKVLYCDVGINEDLLKTFANNKEPLTTISKSIKPTYCPNCCETFEKIVMSIGLSYNTDIIDDY